MCDLKNGPSLHFLLSANIIFKLFYRKVLKTFSIKYIIYIFNIKQYITYIFLQNYWFYTTILTAQWKSITLNKFFFSPLTVLDSSQQNISSLVLRDHIVLIYYWNAPGVSGRMLGRPWIEDVRSVKMYTLPEEPGFFIVFRISSCYSTTQCD